MACLLAMPFPVIALLVCSLAVAFGSPASHLRRYVGCTAQRDIVVVQQDLHFDHPATAVTVFFSCPSCAAARDVHLSCTSARWLQAYVDPSTLAVLGNGQCLLSRGNAFPSMSNLTFIYLHSPPLDLRPSGASFSNCS